MDLGSLRALALELNVSAHSVPITLRRPYPEFGDEIETRGIWVSAVTDDVPGSSEFQRREPRRVLALSRATVAAVPRGSTIVAPEVMGGTVRGWRVDGILQVKSDHHQVIVVRDPDVEALLDLEA